MNYLWLKAFHIIAIVTWFAALFYLPRLFVYHTQAEQEGDQRGAERFCVMERKLYRGIMTPSMLVALALGLALLSMNFTGYLEQGWMRTKLALVVLLLIYHFWCGALLRQFAAGVNRHSHVWYRIFNELPVFILVFVVVLVVVKPW
ncbi:protoporphyrinogen oxidase HemJ [Marinospirillum alkaliphilum]|uniref:Protoporphyrinogen IX oxidase n=1 Tax=Marinospirillum alkaliphilum DSM 21637 TaxID=1122209 RepID=A0A1K1WH93_9GAMM|nr:protoporphyrinogen oxidase HemJ [Marinospirillum alkaliphilum]SFX36802.1 putative membrane protein [Marinospirillum alkaliphilum DSM 21637]